MFTRLWYLGLAAFGLRLRDIGVEECRIDGLGTGWTGSVLLPPDLDSRFERHLPTMRHGARQSCQP